jgi:hypothetical protein
MIFPGKQETGSSETGSKTRRGDLTKANRLPRDDVRSGSLVHLGRVKPEPLELLGPVGRKVAQASDPNPARPRASAPPFAAIPQRLVSGVELELGDGFAIAGIKRGRPEAFDRLSDGTQEKIAVLVRLAMGAMLAERGGAVPIILDDALVYCDDDRIQRMFDASSRAGKYQQIIMLTCRLRSFGPLGG